MIYILPIFVLAGYIHSAPPREHKFLKGKPKGFKTDWVLKPHQVEKLRAGGMIRKAGQKALSVNKTYRILAIRVDFTDTYYDMTTTKAQAEAFFNQLSSYFRENSYGIITVTATVTTRTAGGTLGANGAYRLSSVSNYNDESDAALENLITHSVAAAQTDYSFMNYDHIMIFHAGYGEEDSGDSPDLWSLFTSADISAGGNSFNGFTVVPEKSSSTFDNPLGVICHEYGHQLGLFDFYDTSVEGGRSTCGSWSLMDYSFGYDNTGNNPPHLDPWSKNYLGWIDLSSRVINSISPSVSIGDTETSQTTGYYKLPVEVGTLNEYFIVEYRRPDASKMKFDLTQPATGILIWHIDDTIAMDPSRQTDNSINTGVPWYGVDLVEADEIPHNSYTIAKPGDMFTPGTIFADPLSNAFNGLSTGIALANISFATPGQADFSVTKLAATPSISFIKAINYPNPAGAGYYHPRNASGILTTVVIQYTKPPRAMSMDIYNIAGELVRSAASIKSFRLNIGPSADYKWVYEYDWDGKNNNREAVAPGLYFYRVKADSEVKTGKIAIVR